ncbi:MAG: hypothetical protein ACLSHC_08185 [Bilophila wadsworthia]
MACPNQPDQARPPPISRPTGAQAFLHYGIHGEVVPTSPDHVRRKRSDSNSACRASRVETSKS